MTGPANIPTHEGYTVQARKDGEVVRLTISREDGGALVSVSFVPGEAIHLSGWLTIAASGVLRDLGYE